MSAPAANSGHSKMDEKGQHDSNAHRRSAGATSDPDRAVHAWRIPLQQWRDENRDREYSPEFTLDGENWRVLLFPRGNPSHSVPGCMAAYLELRSDRADDSIVCHFKMQMAHPTEPHKYPWRESTHTFTHTEIDRGFNDLLTPANLADYTHDDGCVLLNVQAYKAPPGFQMRAPVGPPVSVAPAAAAPRGRPLSELEQIHLAALDEEDRLAIQALLEQDRVQAAAAAQARQHRRPRRARADSESEGEDDDDDAHAAHTSESAVDRGQSALESRLCAIVDSDAGVDHSALTDDAACSVCMERPKRTLTVCCAVVGVCTACMKRLLLLQSSGSSSVKCPNCNQSSVAGRPFGVDAVVFNVKR